MSITITERDLRILAALHDHRVMTTPQLGALFFSGGGVRAVQRRLKTLADHQQIERFTPRAARWTMPHHWILGRRGTRTLAAHRGIDPRRIAHPRHLRTSPLIDHITGLAQTYVSFTIAARTTPGARLERWWTEARCRRAWIADGIRPDGYLRWRQNGTVLDAFVEYDTRTEALRVLGEKLDRYRDLALRTGLRSTVLFVVPTPGRLSSVCTTLPAPGPWVQIHVTTPDLLTAPGPAAPIWRTTGDATCHLRTLADLAR
ncbi:replication-relaxation family protein [Nocardiopsis changdeensis]|uniref:replication-relaxation family protein n=1 Tax=Nocardiopsis changdeensis TaxID=2831969 RepID=UPI003F474DE8